MPFTAVTVDCSYSRSPAVTFFKISKLNAGDADAKSAAEWRQRPNH